MCHWSRDPLYSHLFHKYGGSTSLLVYLSITYWSRFGEYYSRLLVERKDFVQEETYGTMFILKVPIHKYLLLTMLFVIHANFVASNFYEEKEPELQPKLNVTVCKPDRTSCRSESYDGEFGKHSPKMGGSGWLLAPVKNNKSGCKEFKTKVSVNPWIALISRGECDFTEKIDNAYKHNATAVIVYNNEEDSGDLVMLHKESQNIVAIFVKKSIGQDLAAALENGTNVVYVEITVASRPSGEFQLNPASVLFVSVSFIVLMVISLAWLVFYYVQRFRYVHARDKTEVSYVLFTPYFLFHRSLNRVYLHVQCFCVHEYPLSHWL